MRRSFVFCNSASADRSGMAASRLLPAAAACVILLGFAAESRESLRFAVETRTSHCNGNERRVNGALEAIFRFWQT